MTRTTFCFLAVAAGLVPAVCAAAPVAEIEKLKDLHLATDLVADGQIACRIVTADDPALLAPARRVQAALSAACGVEIPLLPPAAVSEEDCRRYNLILLGSLLNHAIIARLYARHYCFTDSFYPGPGGYEVRTIHNPLGWGRNCLLLGGSDAAGVQAAAEKFAELLKSPGVLTLADGRRTVRLSRLQAAQSTIPAHEKIDDKFVSATLGDIRQRLDNGLVMQQMHNSKSVIDAGMDYYLTGDERWGVIFREGLLYYHELAQRTGDWMLLELGADAGGQYFWPWKLAIVWDNVEEGPVFNDAQRLTITRLLLHLTRWCADLDHFYLDRPKGAQYGAPGELRQGHPTYAAMSLFFGAEYFRFYYPEIREFQPCYERLDRMFAGQALSYKSNDNAERYATLAPRHYLCHLMTQGPLDPNSARNLRTFADSVIMTTDNRGDGCTYGDGNEYLPGYVDGLPFLSKASWYFRDPGYLWAYDWIERQSSDSLRSTAPRLNIWYEGLYYADGPRTPPQRLLGVVPLRVDQGLYDFLGNRLAESPGERLPAIEQCFDKLSCRRSFEAADEYLLLSGLSGVLTHGHEDGNSVLRLTWRDRIWLADLGYRDKAPSEHNSLMVLRNGRYHAIPACARLESCAELPSAGFVRSRVPGYNGADWTRNIFWLKGRYFLFADDVALREPGDYRLQLVWRTLGETKLSDRTLTATQAGQSFHIANGDASLEELSLKKSTKIADWSRYPHADGTVHVLSQIFDLQSAGSDERAYLNLLHPGDEDLLSVQRVGPRSARILCGQQVQGLVGWGEATDAAGPALTKPLAVREEYKGIRAAAWQIGRESLAVFEASQIALAGLVLRAEGPVSLELDWRTAAGALNALRATTVQITTPAVWLDDQRIPAAPPGDVVQFQLPAGTHHLRLEGQRLEPLGRLLDASRPAAAESAVALPPAVKQASRAWEFQAPAGFKTLATADIDGDGRAEVVIAAGRRVVALSADGTQRWTYRAPAAVSALCLCDVDGDGQAEVLLGADADVCLVDGTGQEKWRYRCAHMEATISALTTGDLDGDGRPEILAGHERSVVFAINADGTPRWQNFADVGRGGVATLLAADLDGDGRAEVFVPTVKDHGAVLLGPDGQQVKWHLSGTQHVARAVTLPGGKSLLVAGGPEGRGPLCLVDPATGHARRPPAVSDDVVDIVPADLDGDGTPELVVLHAMAGLTIYDLSGRVVRQTPVQGIASGLAVADFQGEGKAVLAVGCQNGKVWFLDARGTVLSAADLGSPVIRLAVLADKGVKRLVAGTDNGGVFLLQP